MATFEKVAACPHCGFKVEAVTNMSGGDDGPEDGAFTICIACTEVGVFIEGGTTIRKATDTELLECRMNPHFNAIVATLQAYKAAHGDYRGGTVL